MVRTGRLVRLGKGPLSPSTAEASRQVAWLYSELLLSSCWGVEEVRHQSKVITGAGSKSVKDYNRQYR